MNQQDHIVKSFDSELSRLYGEIQQMGDLAMAQLNAAVDVLNRRDSNAAARVVANDDAIDALENAISKDVLTLLALRQPMARDLREVYSALKISADIERIGDYASNVAKRSIVLNNSAAIPAAARIGRLAKTANQILADALKAYQTSDAELANLIFAPGFSTADTVTELSGRGVGMDVVRAEVNAMGGRVETATAAVGVLLEDCPPVLE